MYVTFENVCMEPNEANREQNRIESESENERVDEMVCSDVLCGFAIFFAHVRSAMWPDFSTRYSRRKPIFAYTQNII